MDSFNRTILIQATHTCVYEALTRSLTKWWTEMFDGVSTKQGQTFTVRFGPNVFKTMVVDELILNKRVVWSVTDSIIDLPELKNKPE